MAPPRRASTRATGATPARNISPSKRSTRGNSVLPLTSSTTKRALRSSSPANDNVTNPNLPEIQIQQSYAYGSSKTPLLPDQLVPREKMTLKQIAATLDSDIRQAEQQIQDHAAEAEANFSSPKDARDERARRRASKDSSQPPSREGSVDSQTHKTKRTEAWANSLDSSQLENISEEDIPDDDTRRDTEPSSFPSGIFDHSYNYERGQRGPRSPAVKPEYDWLWKALKDFLSKAYHVIERLVLSVRDGAVNSVAATARAVAAAPGYILNRKVGDFFRGLGVLSFCILALCASFCAIYKATVCDTDNNFGYQLTMQRYCGSCWDWSLPSLPSVAQNLSSDDRQNFAKFTKSLNAINKQLREMEARMERKIDSKNAELVNSFHDLQRQQHDLETKITNLRSSSPDSPRLLQKVNYFAPGTGAVVNPLLTSPTKQKPLNFGWRVVMNAINVQRYQANPPVSALEPWEDVGDCWCSSATTAPVRLAIHMGHVIYPTELLIEHFPASGSITPDTAPQELEVWADFGHLSPQQWAEYNIDALRGNNPIGTTMAKIGTAHYDIRVGVNHVQTFKMDVNQHDLLLSTKEITLRIVKNYGAENTCLYRVRMHGVPVVPHTKAKAAPEL